MWPRRVAIAALAVGGTLLCLGAIAPLGAAGQPDGARITSYAATALLGDDGLLQVRERVRYDFAGQPADGVTRSWVTTQPYPGDRDRTYELNVGAVGALGADISALHEGKSETMTTLSVDFAEPQSGAVTVRYAYYVEGTLAGTPDGLELRWPLVQGFDLPVRRATATVVGPPLQWLACFAGSVGSSQPCTAATMVETASPQLRQDGIPAGGRMTAVLGYGAESGLAPNAAFHVRWSFARAFSLSALSLALAALVLVLGGLAALALWWTRGRDRPPSAAAVSVAPGGAVPDGIRPGQVGTLVDERADVVDVTATVLDLAVRGYLVVEEAAGAPFGSSDWVLRKRRDPGPELLGYEREVLAALFDGREEVPVSDLGRSLGGRLPVVQARLYDDMVAQGWFAERPDTARSRWTTAGLVLIAAGVVLTVVLAAATTLALVGLALVAAGVALALAGQAAPARTASGTQALRRLSELRDALAAGPGRAGESAEDGRLFPYAVVFGLTDHWASAAGASSGWYAARPAATDRPAALAGLVAALSGTVAGAVRRPLATAADQRSDPGTP